MKLTGEELIELGYTPGKAIGTALKVVNNNFERLEKEEVLALLLKVFQYPENYLADPVLSPIADDLLVMLKNAADAKEIPLKESPDAFSIFGKQHIEQGALSQMEVAMKVAHCCCRRLDARCTPRLWLTYWRCASHQQRSNSIRCWG